MPYNKTARNRKNKKSNKKSNKNKNKTTRKTRGGEGEKTKKHLMKFNVFITPEQPGVDKRKIEYDIRTYHGFFDYLNEVDAFLKNILNEEILSFADPSGYKRLLENRKRIKKTYMVDLEKPVEKPDEKPVGKPDEKPVGKPDEKPVGKPVEISDQNLKKNT